MSKFEINSIVSAKGYFVINAITEVNEFWVSLGEKIGYGRFTMLSYENEAIGLKLFVLEEVLPASCPIPHPVIASFRCFMAPPGSDRS